MIASEVDQWWRSLPLGFKVAMYGEHAEAVALRAGPDSTSQTLREPDPLPEPGPWTSHGHSVEGVTIAGPKPPGMQVARCGGSTICRQCGPEAARMQAEARAR